MDEEIRIAFDAATLVCARHKIVPTAFLYETSAYHLGLQGRSLMHVRQDLNGQFADGHRIRTSIVTGFQVIEAVLIVQTLSFSHYVVIGYAPGTSLLQVITELRSMLGYTKDDDHKIYH